MKRLNDSKNKPKRLLFFTQIVKNTVRALTESTDSDGNFEYLGEFDFIFETNLWYYSGDQVGIFDFKNQRSKISCKLYLYDQRRRPPPAPAPTPGQPRKTWRTVSEMVRSPTQCRLSARWEMSQTEAWALAEANAAGSDAKSSAWLCPSSPTAPCLRWCIGQEALVEQQILWLDHKKE